MKKKYVNFKITNLGYYHDLYVQSDTLLLANVFANFRNNCIEIYELEPARFSSAPGLAWKSYFKKIKNRIKIII